MSEKTEWFPADVKPKREGWYEVKGQAILSGQRLYWSGRRWKVYPTRRATAIFPWDGDLWRGLAAPK